MDEIRQQLEKEGFELLEQIGSGGFSTAYTVRWLLFPDLLYVAKLTKMNREKPEKDIVIQKEIESLQKIDHRNVINIYKYFQIPDYHVMILEYCKNGSLKSYVDKNGPFKGAELIDVIHQCILGLNECHKIHIVHLDIKPENILIDEFNRIKIADFGLASFVSSREKINIKCGSLFYLSPERCNKGFFDPKKADIWSLGMTFYYIKTGKYPFKPKTEAQLIIAIQRLDVTFSDEDDPLNRMILRMLFKDPIYRPICEELLKTCVFDEYHKDIPVPQYGTPTSISLPKLFSSPTNSSNQSLSCKLRCARKHTKRQYRWSRNLDSQNILSYTLQFVNMNSG